MSNKPNLDHSFPVHTPPPPDYPRRAVPDAYASESISSDYAARRQALLEHVLRNPAPADRNAPYYELVRVAVSRGARDASAAIPHQGVFQAGMDYVERRKDGADLVLHALLRLLYQFADHPALDQALLERARATVLGFKYWPDEPGVDGMCTWTESHQILFAAAGYLAGQLYPEELFTNSRQTGRGKMAAHRPRVLRWLELRFRAGFSEWLSHVSYDADLVALVNLVDFCEEAEIADRAAMVIDLSLADMALNSLRGAFGSTHGRGDPAGARWAAEEATSDTSKLLFGVGSFALRDNVSAVCLALSERYRMPRVLYHIADDLKRPEMLNRQRMGLRLADAEHWGLGFEDFEDGMVWQGMGAYAHPSTVELGLRMCDAFNWWDNPVFAPFKARRRSIEALRRTRLLSLAARLFERDLTRDMREEVNLYTYRTPDYMLSSAQDYRPGYGGEQQHIWQATLGPELGRGAGVVPGPGAVCFTTHPARRGDWTGSGSLPRVAQVKNVLIAIYNIDSRPDPFLTRRLKYTQAWLPRDQFDEVVELEGWIFARKGEAYLALRAQHPYSWGGESGADGKRELVVPGKRNVWLCELGRRAVDGPFANFVRRIAAAPLSFRRLGVSYQSPSQGHLDFGWRGPLRQGGQVVLLSEYPRYDNPYARANFPLHVLALRRGQHWLRLDWEKGRREASSFV